MLVRRQRPKMSTKAQGQGMAPDLHRLGVFVGFGFAFVLVEAGLGCGFGSLKWWVGLGDVPVLEESEDPLWCHGCPAR